MKHFLMKISLRNRSVGWKSILAGMPPTILRIVAAVVMLFLLTSVFFGVLGCFGGSVKAGEASGSRTTTCPYCGDTVSQLYRCTNTGCDYFTKVGCTNPGIDQDGYPKCLYKYVYGAYCRKCNSSAKVVWSIEN
jgi:hypothetical protein